MGLKTTGLGGGSDAEHDAPIVAEINITPLTDIFLVLLIIFMVTSSALSQMGVEVQLPKASAVTAQTKPEGVIVTLLPQGELRVNGKPARLAELQPALKAAFEKAAGKLVILEGDRQAFLGFAIEVMEEAKKAGAESFAIATETEGAK